MERERKMNNRYLEAVAVGIITAVLAGFFGVGAQRTEASAVPPASSVPLAADLLKGGH
jgi:hypothetical protein